MATREYVKTAVVIRAALIDAADTSAKAAVAQTARQLADAFKHLDHEFTYTRFFHACGLDQWGELLPNPVFNEIVGRD